MDMLFSSKKEGKIKLILSIQSSVVRGTLVWFRHEKKPFILYSISKQIKYRSNVDSSYLPKTTLSHIDDVLEETLRELHVQSRSDRTMPGKIDEIHYILSSPWIVSYAHTVRRDLERPVLISRKTVSDIIAAEREKVFANSTENLVVAEEKIFDVRLNGYSIAEWEGKNARSLEVSFSAGILDRKTVEHFREACEHVVRKKSVLFHSSLLIHCIGAQELMPEKKSYIMLHVHGEITDAVIVENGMCTLFGSFDVGVNTVVRHISSALRTTEAVADSMLTLFVGGKMTNDEEREKAVIAEISDKWYGALEKMQKDAGYERNVPDTAIITARTHEEFFMGSFKAHKSDAKTDTISIDLVAERVEYSSKVERLRLSGLFALALTLME